MIAHKQFFISMKIWKIKSNKTKKIKTLIVVDDMITDTGANENFNK